MHAVREGVPGGRQQGVAGPAGEPGGDREGPGDSRTAEAEPDRSGGAAPSASSLPSDITTTRPAA
ncbi:hypothetical protein ABTY53_16570 [Streptomyces noursei]|uniref:hypothetical protein n=1 Tax=Streptomyces noursei TaxID=1971 RepID=UPI003320DB73